MSDLEKRPMNDGIIDITLDTVERTSFRINSDNDAIIKLNLSDLGIISRLETSLKKLKDEMTKIANLPDDADMSESLKEADKRMREHVDFIFDYPVSAVCAKYGTMYDPKNGKFRYETIIEGLLKLYSDNINSEYKQLESRLSKHTDKYIKKKR